MIAITLYRSLGLGRAHARMTPEKERLNLQLLLVNAGLAVAVLFFSSLTAAFSLPLVS